MGALDVPCWRAVMVRMMLWNSRHLESELAGMTWNETERELTGR